MRRLRLPRPDGDRPHASHRNLSRPALPLHRRIRRRGGLPRSVRRAGTRDAVPLMAGRRRPIPTKPTIPVDPPDPRPTGPDPRAPAQPGPGRSTSSTRQQPPVSDPADQHDATAIAGEPQPRAPEPHWARTGRERRQAPKDLFTPIHPRPVQSASKRRNDPDTAIPVIHPDRTRSSKPGPRPDRRAQTGLDPITETRGPRPDRAIDQAKT